MVRSPSPPAGKYLKSGEQRFDRILRLANETSLVEPRVSASPSETCLAFQYFPTPTNAGTSQENRDPGMDVHGPVHKSPQAYQ